MKSLTRDMLLALKPTVKKLEVEGFGIVWVKSLDELTRSRRAAAMYNEKGELDRTVFEQRRGRVIIDQVCDEDGKPLFSNSDLPELLKLDGISLDKLFDAILEFNEAHEGNVPSE
jgi:hypothetical protein